jgi:hypothetical protein
MEVTHEPLHQDKWSLIQQKVMGIFISCIRIVISFDEACKYGDGTNF